GSATSSVKLPLTATGPVVAESTQSPTRTTSVCSTVASVVASVTDARLRLPTARPVGSAVSTRSPLPVPLAVTLSQPWSELAVQAAAAPRLSATCTVRVRIEDPGVFVSATPFLATSSLCASRLKVTGIDAETVSPLTVAANVTVPVRVPPARPVLSGVTSIVAPDAEVVPDGEERDIHVVPGVAVQA